MSGFSHVIFSGTVHHFLMQNIKMRYQNIKVGYHNSNLCSFPPNHALYHPPLQKIVTKFISLVKEGKGNDLFTSIVEVMRQNQRTLCKNKCLVTPRPQNKTTQKSTHRCASLICITRFTCISIGAYFLETPFSFVGLSVCHEKSQP